jgi:hypothetical protein
MSSLAASAISVKRGIKAPHSIALNGILLNDIRGRKTTMNIHIPFTKSMDDLSMKDIITAERTAQTTQAVVIRKPE